MTSPPSGVGSFDVVILGSLLLHLRDPVRALEAIRSVTNGVFMSVEAVVPPLSACCSRGDRWPNWPPTTSPVNGGRPTRPAIAACSRPSGFEILALPPPVRRALRHVVTPPSNACPAHTASDRAFRALCRATLGDVGVPPRRAARAAAALIYPRSPSPVRPDHRLRSNPDPRVGHDGEV